MMHARSEYLNDETMVELELDMASELRAALCDGADLDCRSQPLQNEIILPSTLACTPGTVECDVDTVRVVKVAEGRYWEYLHPACVEQAFYEGGKKLGVQYNEPGAQALCGNPLLPTAFEAYVHHRILCCSKFIRNCLSQTFSTSLASFLFEQVLRISS